MPRPVARRLLGLLTLLGAAAYALPLLAPPPTHPVPVRTVVDEGIWVRMYPYLPSLWVLLRLGALGLAAVAAVAAARVRLLRPLPPPRLRAAPRLTVQRLAVVLALTPLLVLPLLASLPAWAQAAYMVAPWLPALVYAWDDRIPARRRRLPDTSLRVALALVVAWFCLRLWVSWASPRLADPVDMWRTYEGLAKMWSEGGNYLVQSFGRELVGINASPYFLQGLPLLQWFGMPPFVTWVQVWNTLWFALAGVGVALLARRCIGRGAELVAVAGYAFSPYVLLGPMNLTPMFVGPVFAVLPPLLLLRFVQRGSYAALAAFGPACGLAMSHPALAALSATWMALGAAVAWRRARPSPAVVLCAVGGFAATLLPSLPGPSTLGQMVDLYAQSRGQVPVLEATVLAQVSAEVGNTAGWKMARTPPPFDVPLAVALAPFVVSRTSIRLIGDTILDPIGAVLVAVGLVAACIRGGRALVLVVLLGAAMGMAVVSSTDHPSLLRFYGAPIPLALLAGVGFVQLRAALGLRHRLWPVVVAGLMAAGGSYVFDVVNPTILRGSAAGIALRAVAPADVGRASYLTSREESPFWRSEYLMLRGLGVPAMGTASAEAMTVEVGPRRFSLDGRLLLWSPAVEAQLEVTRRLCGTYGDGVVYELFDTARLSRLFGFTTSGQSWTPALPPGHWRSIRCVDVPQATLR